MSSKLTLCLVFALFTVSAQASVDHALFNDVLKLYVVNGAVDYPSIKKDERFAAYLKTISAVKPAKIKDDQDRLAFWINAYNAFTIKLVLDHFPVQSIRDIKQGETGPWDVVGIEIGGRQYSLNQIEHEIIRKEFDEPRIHMALVCAAISCPPLRSEAYTGRRLDTQLEDNARIFLRDKSKNDYDEASNTLHLSELFSWYGSDFVKKYGSAEKFVVNALAIRPATPPTIKFLPYDWSLNSKQ